MTARLCHDTAISRLQTGTALSYLAVALLHRPGKKGIAAGAAVLAGAWQNGHVSILADATIAKSQSSRSLRWR